MTKIQMQSLVNIFHKHAFTHSSEVPQLCVIVGHPWLAIVSVGVVGTGASVSQWLLTISLFGPLKSEF